MAWGEGGGLGENPQERKKKLTITQLGDAQCRQLYENQQPRGATIGGETQRQILERKHGVDQGEHGEAGDEDRSWAEPSDGAREDGELEEAVNASVHRHPQADRRRAQLEPAKLNWRGPDEWDERHGYHPEEREHSVIG